MKVLIKNGLVIDPANGIKEKSDILIENDNVIKIDKDIKDEVNHIIDAKGLIVSPGFVDLHANFCDPGATAREDLKTGSLAAAKGGFTHVVLGTDNKPSPSESNVIDYIIKYSKIMPINLYPSAAVTIDRLGYEIADIQFLHNHGAIAFYDGLKPIEDKILREKIMLAVKKFDGVLSIFSEKDENESRVRGILDTPVAGKLSVKTPTAINAEYDDLIDILDSAKFTKCKLDLAYVTSAESIDAVEKAKKEGIDVVAEVPVINIALTDKDIEKKGTNAKVLPALRPEADRKAILKGLKRNVIDIISSNHVPVESDDKDVKMKDAICGSIGLETLLGICGSELVEESVLSWKDVIEKISLNPAKLYGLDKEGVGSITKGKKANITIFDPKEKWKLTEETIVSKSHNTPFIGTEMIGRVKYTLCNGKLVYKDVKAQVEK